MNPTTPTQKSTSNRRSIWFAVIGFLVGAASMYSLFEIKFQRKGTDVWVANEQIQADGIVIPAGTKFVQSYAFSEGFNQLALNLNVDAAERNRFKIEHDPKTDMQFPYWVKGKPTSQK